jgi:hypothetical protein
MEIEEKNYDMKSMLYLLRMFLFSQLRQRYRCINLR